MNVLHVLPRYYPCAGGSELYFQEIGERLAREGHRVSVYTTEAWDVEHFWARGKRTIAARTETHNGVEIHRFPVRRLPLAPRSYLAVRRGMAELSNLPFDLTRLLLAAGRFTPWVPELDRALAAPHEKFDLIHAANLPFDSIIYSAWRLARREKIPLVVTPFLHLGEPHDSSVLRYYTLRNQLAMLRDADAVIVQTELEKEELARHGVVREKMHRVGMGINPDQLCGGDAGRFRARYNIHTPVVFALGTTTYDKGMFHLIAAMDKLWAQNCPATLVIAGPTVTPFESFFAAQSDRVKQNTRVLGLVPPDMNRNDLLAAGDVFALPSRTDSFGMVYLEAWFYAKPVIGARAGGVPEVIEEGRDGFLVNFGDVDLLAARLAQLLDDPALARRLGEAGRSQVLANHTWDRKYNLIREIYQHLAG